MMKKLFVVVIGLAACFGGFISCGEDGPKDPTENNGSGSYGDDDDDDDGYWDDCYCDDGDCVICDGDGIYGGVECHRCDGTGECQTCHGEGGRYID